MGQKVSAQSPTTHSIPLVWILRGQHKMHNPNPEQPIKFQYKTRRKYNSANNSIKSDKNKFLLNNNLHLNNLQETKLLANKLLDGDKKAPVNNNVISRTISEPNLVDSTKRHSKHRRKNAKKLINSSSSPKNGSGTNTPNCNNVPIDNQGIIDKFGYEIQDIDQFLAKASIEKPANIPVVLSVATVLYQTRVGGYQEEVALPLGMVVNAVFRNQSWLYAQTPHGEEGYIAYAACIPLGIIPAADDAGSPCWETSTDVFPRPSGNMTDTEKLSSARSECSTGRCRRSRRARNAASACGERSVDRLYLRAAAATKTGVQRHTLLVVTEAYAQEGENTISVTKGDVVTLLSTHAKGWFWVRRKEGCEGFIPAVVAGHGFL